MIHSVVSETWVFKMGSTILEHPVLSLVVCWSLDFEFGLRLGLELGLQFGLSLRLGLGLG